MISLALDCSTALGGVVLAWGDDLNVLTREEFVAGRGRGGELFRVLERAMHAVRASGDRLDEVVVGLGPGSYSGVRQVIAAAVGLAAATGARLGGVPSVLALRGVEGCYQTVGDARRGAFYYAAVREKTCVAGPELLPDSVALQDRLAERSDWPVFVVDTALPGGLLGDTPIATVDASALLAVPRAVHMPPPLEPIYLRPVSITLPKTGLAPP